MLLVDLSSQNPKKFEEVFDEMISFLEHADHWPNTEMELAAWGVSSCRSLKWFVIL